MLDRLPEDVQVEVLSLLGQAEVARVSQTCTSLHKVAARLLYRELRCVTCGAHLLDARALERLPRETRRRRAFYQLRTDVPHALAVDTRKGAANFHVIRHLAQTAFRNVRFPVAADVQAVRALRCAGCGVFVGFRHAGVTGIARDYVHNEFVEIVNANDVRVHIDGSVVPSPQNVVRCANKQCANLLFRREDIVPWSHVLASSRLTDMDPYLEWDHSWAGVATASQPAFFVKRVQQDAVAVQNRRPEQLRQGLMEVADAHCAKCHAHVGWKIIAEVPASSNGLLVNYDQTGRYGIIRTAVTPSEPRYNL